MYLEVEMPRVGPVEVVVHQLEAMHRVEAMDLEMAVHLDFEVVMHQVEEVNLEVAMHRAEAID